MVTDVKLLQLEKACMPIVLTELGIFSVVKPQYIKDCSPIDVTVFGMVVFLQPIIKLLVSVSIIALQLSRESYLLLSSSTIIDDKEEQSKNVDIPIDVVELGIDTEVNDVHP